MRVHLVVVDGIALVQREAVLFTLDGPACLRAYHGRVDLVQKATAHSRLLLAIQEPAPGVRQEQLLLGTGGAHVKQAALLLQLLPLLRRTGERKEALLQPADKHDGEFQPLRGVQRHERHAVALAFVFIQIREQGHFLQEGRQRSLLGLRGKLGDRTDELLHILPPAEALTCVLVTQLVQHARLLDERPCQLVGWHRLGLGSMGANQKAKPLDGVLRARREPRFVDLLNGLPGREALASGVLKKPLLRFRPDAARRIVDDAAQAGLVRRIDEEAEVRQHILDFFALIKRHAANDAVRNTPAP